jgi:hypothetical protein
MGLNDEMEKLRQAETWLTETPVLDHGLAGWEHLQWVIGHTHDPVLFAEASRIVAKVESWD